MSSQLRNIILLGFGFMFVFISFQTISNIEKTILDSIHKDDPTFTGNAFVSLAIVYISVALFNWAAPSVISVTGPRFAMVVGSVCYLLFASSFLIPTTAILYIASAVLGFGAALIWTGQGNYLVLNSTESTLSRNSSLFWAMLQCSLLFGNLFVFFAFQDKSQIDVSIRTRIFIVFSIVSVIGILFLLILKPAVDSDGNEPRQSNNGSPLDAFKSSLGLCKQSRIMLLMCTFFYTGLLLSFSSGVYGPSIGFTKKIMDNPKQLIGISGILFGAGEIFGGIGLIALSKGTNRAFRSLVVFSGFLTHLLSFIFVFINLPNNAPFGNTSDISFIQPNAYLAVFSSFLLGFGDSCFNTQIYSIIGLLYPENSAPAFALFKFIQSLSSAIGFMYSNIIGLYAQIAILTIFVILGTLTYVFVDRQLYNNDNIVNNREISPDSQEST